MWLFGEQLSNLGKNFYTLLFGLVSVSIWTVLFGLQVVFWFLWIPPHYAWHKEKGIASARFSGKPSTNHHTNYPTCNFWEREEPEMNSFGDCEEIFVKIQSWVKHKNKFSLELAGKVGNLSSRNMAKLLRALFAIPFAKNVWCYQIVSSHVLWPPSGITFSPVMMNEIWYCLLARDLICLGKWLTFGIQNARVYNRSSSIRKSKFVFKWKSACVVWEWFHCCDVNILNHLVFWIFGIPFVSQSIM